MGAASDGGCFSNLRIFEVAVEVTAHPAEKKKSHGEEGGANGHDKGFGIPTVVEKVVEENEAEGEEANEADEHTERHEHGLEDCAFALTGKPFGKMGESSHGETKMLLKNEAGKRLRQITKSCPIATYCKIRIVSG